MAKQITQETFDAAVSENIVEFEMTPEEALAETIQQFESQGVDLSRIVKDSHSTGDAKHDIIVQIEVLSNCLSDDPPRDPTKLLQVCRTFKALCDKDLATRCLADKHGAYPVLIKLLETPSSWDLTAAILGAMASFFNSNPDPLDDHGTKLLMARLADPATGPIAGLATGPITDPTTSPTVDSATSSIADPVTSRIADLATDSIAGPVTSLIAGPATSPIAGLATSSIVVAQILNVVHRCCQKHESNRQRFVSEGLVAKLAAVLLVHHADRGVVVGTCEVYATLTLDDDIRVPFGKGHDNAKLIVTESNAIETLLSFIPEYTNDLEVTGELFATIGRLAVRDDFCKRVSELGGVATILTALQGNIQHKVLVRSVLSVLKVIAGSDVVKVEVVREGGVELVLEAIKKHQRNAPICDVGCATIAALVLRFPEHCGRVMNNGGPDCIIKCLQLHQDVPAVQKSACMAIRNVVGRCPANSPGFLELGVEQLLRDTMKRHDSCRDEAKAALRDLGCHVELKELWTGTGPSLQN